MILVTGATGFIGGQLLQRLVAEGRPARALVRPGSPREFLARRGVEVVEGDVTDPASLRAAVTGCRRIVHLVGLIVDRPGRTFESVVAEGTASLVAAAEAAGVERFIYVSALGAAPDALSRYHRTKAAAEAAVRGSRLGWIILRPSVVYGPGDGLVSLYASRPLPLPGSGQTRVQPIHIRDVVEVLVQCLDRDDVLGETFALGGPEALTYRELVARLGRLTGRRLPHPALPGFLVETGAWLCDALRGPLGERVDLPPLSRDTLLLLAEDNTCDPSPAAERFGLRLTRFDEGVTEWLAPTVA